VLERFWVVRPTSAWLMQEVLVLIYTPSLWTGALVHVKGMISLAEAVI
jgi:hypothetical protein